MTIRKELRYYMPAFGKPPFERWLDDFDDRVTRSRINRRLERLAEGNFGDYKFLGEGIYELRLAFGPGYRVYFSQEPEHIILLFCGGDKSTQAKDISTAKHYLKELREASYDP